MVVFHNNLPEINFGAFWEVATTAAYGQTFESLPGKAGGLPFFGYNQESTGQFALATGESIRAQN